MNPPMQNGIPPQWYGSQPPQKSPNFNAQPMNNGLGSSQSSRDSSPMSRLPAPPRGNIPPSQLPPGAQIKPSLNGPTVTSASVTPHSSPRMVPFSTSTPINNKDGDIVQVNNVSQPQQNVVRSLQQQSAFHQNMQHASSAPALPQIPPVKQNLNQLQNVQRPVSTGPPVQPNFEPLQNQSHFSQSQSQLQLAGQMSASQQPSVPPYQQQLPGPSLQQQSAAPPFQQQAVAPPHQQQLPNQQQSASPLHQPQSARLMPVQQQLAPPLLHQQQSAPLPPHQQYAPTLQQQRQQFQNSATSPVQPQSQSAVPPPFVNLHQQPRLPPPINNQFVSTPQNIGPPSQIPQNANFQPMTQPQSLAQAPPVSSVSTPVSNLHAKRYPQPVQNQIPQQSVYQAQSQQNANVPQQYQQPYNNQQQSNAYYQQQQQYPQNYQQQLNQQKNLQNLPQQMQNLNVAKSGFNKLWGHDNYDLLQCPNVLPEEQVEPPKVSLGQEYLDNANCSHEIFRCTITKIPVSSSLLQKSRLPLGVLIHPFKDLNHLPVISCNTIVRCRACRTYINPFVFFVDTKRWKCNLCYRVNELPEEFQYDPVSKTYGDPSRRPEIKSSTIEYIAPSEYMLRPPQPAVYLFLLDISRLAIESGYLHTICEVLSGQLATLPGDARTQIGFLAYNSTLHFFSLAEGLNQPQEMIVSDIDDVFLPRPDNLLVNLKEHIELVADLLTQFPTRYQNSFDNGSALGAALQTAFKLMGATGGRVTVFQATLPQLGPGALTAREDPNQRAGKEAPHLNPAIDFYKRLALDCSGHQVAVDLFLMNSQYIDIATLSGISRFSGGCMYHFPLFKASKVNQSESLERCFRRYLTRKIGFEAVMRIRCTRGLAIHTFHGNFFVRSTDLLSLPNVNPDAGFGMQVSIEESLSDIQSVCFQAALLYTSSKGERRIRVHTLCLPVVSTLSDVLNSADQQCIVGLLAKMAVDRSLQSSLSDARDAFINVAIDILSSYKLSLNMGNSSNGLLAPQSFKLLPLYILALLKCMAFRTGQSTRLDDRVFAMCEMKTLPLPHLVQAVYPDLYPIYRLAECPSEVDEDGTVTPRPRRLQLTARNIDSHGAYLLDAGQEMIIFVCQNASQQFLVHCLGVPNYNSIPENCFELQKIENPDNERLHAFINRLNDEKPYPAALQIMRENSPNRNLMLEHLIEDRIEYALSYNEFLQHLKTQVK